MLTGYDLIGDIHGQAGKLKALLTAMDYRCEDGVYRHPHRRAIFVGDFIDRGPQQLETVGLARAMVENGTALAIMGNHEFNAIAWATEDPEHKGQYLRPHSPKNFHQHAAFLAEAEQDAATYKSTLDWFWTLPLYLDLPELRVIHACWHPEHLAQLTSWTTPDQRLTPELLVAASRKASAPHAIIETLLKGLEVTLPDGHRFRDKDGNYRTEVRVRWWDTKAETFQNAALIDEQLRDKLPPARLPGEALIGYTDAKPVFFGHYWLTGKPAPLSEKVGCLDYSAGAGGPLVGYRWDGETALRAKNFYSAAA
jgi:hypothetical protein